MKLPLPIAGSGENMTMDSEAPMQQEYEISSPEPTVKTDSQYRAFSVQKDGNKSDENEDAYPATLENEQSFICIAIADGATESAFAKLWANLLVKGAIAKVWSKKTISADMESICHTWANEIKQMDLPWHSEIKVQQGDYATLLCLYIHQPIDSDNHAGQWHALAIGDCCLFHYRGDKLLETFPMMHAQDFNNRPPLINSIHAKNVKIWEKWQEKNGEWENGDEFILFTDALAAWYFGEIDAGRNPFQQVHEIADIESFEKFVTEQRTVGYLRNDDTTMIRLRVQIDSHDSQKTSK